MATAAPNHITARLPNIPTEWITAKWTDDEAAYLKIRQQIDARPTLTVDEVNGFLREAQRTNDPKSTFRWVYAYYIAQKTFHLFHYGGVGPIMFMKCQWPNNYQCARIRFIVSVEYRTFANLIPMGQRLMKRDPKDYDVEFAYADLLTHQADDPKSLASAIVVAQQIVKQNKTKASAYSLLADTHFGRYLYTESTDDIQPAIDNYKIYLALTRPDDTFRSHAMDIIRRLEVAKKRKR